jgi:ribosome-binding factor A
MNRRVEKVQALLQKEVGEYLKRQELTALTTISKVEATPDLKHAKVWVTIFGDNRVQETVFGELNNCLKEMQRELNRKLKMRFVPRISFTVDHAEEYSSHIEDLLRKIKNN